MTARRVLYAPRNISGQPTEYAEGVRPLGYDGEVWSYGPVAYGYQVDRMVDPDVYLADPRARWVVLDAAVRGFDIYHFQYARSLLTPLGDAGPELWDLPLLKSLGKKVFMHFRGSDVRLRSVHIQREPDSYFLTAGIPCDESAILARVAIARRFCDALFVSTPGLLDYVPDAVWIPHAIDPVAWERPPRPEPRIPVVLHAPSRRGTKGSDIVDDVLRDLDRRGVCRYRPVSGLDRPALKAAMQDADLVVDSIGIGDHGMVSVEAMAAGAIPLAHIHERNRARNPGVPVVEATAASLGAVVQELASSPARRAELREHCRFWVCARHDRRVVGRRLAEFYSRPARQPDLKHPEWPRGADVQRVARLEEEVAQLRAHVARRDLQGVGHLGRGLPAFVVDRLLARIHELESRLAAATPDAAHLPPFDRVGYAPRTENRVVRDLKDFAARSPAARKTYKRARAAVRRLRA